MTLDEKDFSILYKDTPQHRRSNSNLPGHFIYPLTSLESEAVAADTWRSILEESNPGFEPSHVHTAACWRLGEIQTNGENGSWETELRNTRFCAKWNWGDYGIPNDYNPIREFVAPYEQLSRAEAMKGSQQVVMGFQTLNQTQELSMGNGPQLLPKPGGNQPTIIIQNGMKEARKGPRIVGLGGK